FRRWSCLIPFVHGIVSRTSRPADRCCKHAECLPSLWTRGGNRVKHARPPPAPRRGCGEGYSPRRHIAASGASCATPRMMPSEAASCEGALVSESSDQTEQQRGGESGSALPAPSGGRRGWPRRSRQLPAAASPMLDTDAIQI